MAIFNKDYLKEHMIYSNNNSEELNEQTVYRGKGKKNNYSIFSDVQIGRNFGVDPYIKVYNGLDQNKATEVVRVSMKTGAPLPTEHTNSGKDGGKGRLKFSKEVAKFLTDAMMDKPNAYKYPDSIKTVYDAIYYDIKRGIGNNEKFIQYPIPDFMENVE